MYSTTAGPETIEGVVKPTVNYSTYNGAAQ